MRHEVLARALFLGFTAIFAGGGVLAAEMIPARGPVAVMFYPVLEGISGDPDCRYLDGTCFIRDGDDFALITTYEIQSIPGEHPGINFKIQKSDAENLSNLMKRHLGAKVALATHDAIITAPTVKSTFDNTSFTLSLPDQKSQQRVLELLEGKLAN